MTDTIAPSYPITLTLIKGQLDDETCPDFSDCSGEAQAQFYYTDDQGERQMTSVCFPCLVPAIRYLVTIGHNVAVEVPRG